MKFLLHILKGCVMGIANVIPGVSGGTMAVSMGIYDTLIHSITHLFKEFKKSMKALVPIGIGMVIGVVGLATLITLLFDKAPVPTNLLFIGLILGGLPAVLRRLKGEKFKITYAIGFLIFFCMVAGFAYIGHMQGKDDAEVLANTVITPSILNVIKLFLVGIVSAATMVIPGVSGSMILKLMGYYEPVFGEIPNFIVAIKNWDVSALKQGLFIFIPFGIGVLLGIIFIAKLIELLLKKFSGMVFSCILGLIVASPFAIVIMNLESFKAVNVMQIVLAVVCLVVGFAVAFLLDRMSVKQAAKEEIEKKNEG